MVTMYGAAPLAAAAALSLVKFGQRTRVYETNPSATTSVGRLMQNNPNRVEFTVVNLGTQTVYIAANNQPSVTNGIPIQPNGGVTMLVDEDGEQVAYDWYIIAVSGTQSLYLQEVLAD